MTKLEIKGNWNIIKGKLIQKFGQLTDMDLVYILGKEEELLGRLQRKLGKSREEIIQLIKSINSRLSIEKKD